MTDSTMSNMLKDKNILAARLSGYAAAAGALIVLNPNSDAQVIYSGEKDSSLMWDDRLYVDFNNDTIADVVLGGYFATYTNYNYGVSWPYNYFHRYYRGQSAFISLSSSQGRLIKTYSGYYMAALPERYKIDENLSSYNYWTYDSYLYLGNDYQYNRYRSFSTSVYLSSIGTWTIYRTHTIINDTSTSGNFINQGDKFIGVKFSVDTLNYYGWVRVSMPDSLYGVNLEVIDWAYQSAPNRGLYTGVDTVPPAVNFTVAPGANFYIDIEFEEEILDTLNQYDLDIADGSLDSLVEIVPYRHYRAYIDPDNYGMLVLTIPQDKIRDLWGLGNEEESARYDLGQPNALPGAQEAGFKVYPNPVVNVLNIDLPLEGRVTITDAEGRVMMVKDNVRNEKIDVSGFNAGMYIVKIQTPNSIAVQKIVKE